MSARAGDEPARVDVSVCGAERPETTIPAGCGGADGRTQSVSGAKLPGTMIPAGRGGADGRTFASGGGGAIRGRAGKME